MMKIKEQPSICHSKDIKADKLKSCINKLINLSFFTYPPDLPTEVHDLLFAQECWRDVLCTLTQKLQRKPVKDKNKCLFLLGAFKFLSVQLDLPRDAAKKILESPEVFFFEDNLKMILAAGKFMKDMLTLYMTCKKELTSEHMLFSAVCKEL